MIAGCIAVLVFAFVILLCILSKPEQSNESDSEYYEDGYHIYYDRKIIRKLKNK